MYKEEDIDEVVIWTELGPIEWRIKLWDTITPWPPEAFQVSDFATSEKPLRKIIDFIRKMWSVAFLHDSPICFEKIKNLSIK